MEASPYQIASNPSIPLWQEAAAALVHFSLQVFLRVCFAGAAIGFWLALLRGVLPVEAERRLKGWAVRRRRVGEGLVA